MVEEFLMKTPKVSFYNPSVELFGQSQRLHEGKRGHVL
jgi:hypothetical protein